MTDKRTPRELSPKDIPAPVAQRFPDTKPPMATGARDSKVPKPNPDWRAPKGGISMPQTKEASMKKSYPTPAGKTQPPKAPPATKTPNKPTPMTPPTKLPGKKK